MVYIFLADGFEEMEALCPYDILKRGGVEVKTVGIGKMCAVSKRGLEVKTDVWDNELELDKIEAVILPGGIPGADNLYKSKNVYEAVKHCFENDKITGAICAAPYMLGAWGFAKNKNVTVFPDSEYYEKLKGANVTDLDVVTDGNIITAKAAGSSMKFAFELLEKLKGLNTRKSIEKQIYYE